MGWKISQGEVQEGPLAESQPWVPYESALAGAPELGSGVGQAQEAGYFVQGRVGKW